MRREDDYPALKVMGMACEGGKKYKEVTRYGGEECGLGMEWVWGLLVS